MDVCDTKAKYDYDYDIIMIMLWYNYDNAMIMPGHSGNRVINYFSEKIC